MTGSARTSKRQFPPIYEKLVPIAITILALVVLGMLAFTLAVAFGAFSG